MVYRLIYSVIALIAFAGLARAQCGRSCDCLGLCSGAANPRSRPNLPSLNQRRKRVAIYKLPGDTDTVIAPSGALFALCQVWGAGSGGNESHAGSGGGYRRKLYSLSGEGGESFFYSNGAIGEIGGAGGGSTIGITGQNPDIVAESGSASGGGDGHGGDAGFKGGNGEQAAPGAGGGCARGIGDGVDGSGNVGGAFGGQSSGNDGHSPGGGGGSGGTKGGGGQSSIEFLFE